MKFCYLDESGTGTEPFAVMVGVLVDSKRMNLTKVHWEELLFILSKIVDRKITEIHTCDFYAGNGPWRDIKGGQRAAIITAVFDWLQERKHHLVYSAVDKVKFKRDFQYESYAKQVGSLWRLMALHCVLAIQKNFQNSVGNKGNTVLIFDNKDQEAKGFTELVKEPPDWTDSYYNRAPKQGQLDQIVDVPYFGDSRQVGLIQVADFISFFVRRFVEIREGAISPDYPDEPERLSGWIATAMASAISKLAIYPSKRRCECADIFYRYAPKCLL